MTTTNDDLINDLLRRADASDVLAEGHSALGRTGDSARCAGKAAAYRHAAELARDAVAAAVAEEREACARLCDERAEALRAAAGHGNLVAWDRAGTADGLAASIRGRAW